ncbi:MAG: hypothetical protein ACI9OJ_005449 [Myxococcota bacterium]
MPTGYRNVHHATRVGARSVSQVYCYQAPSTTIDFRPTQFLNIDDQRNETLALLAAYGSQTQCRLYLTDDAITATAKYWGRFAGFGLVEPVEVLREHH